MADGYFRLLRRRQTHGLPLHKHGLAFLPMPMQKRVDDSFCMLGSLCAQLQRESRGKVRHGMASECVEPSAAAFATCS